MYGALLVVFLIVAICLIGLILLQQGKGATMGASFGAGASSTLFGSSGSGSALTKATGILAALFFVLSLILGNLVGNHSNQKSEWDTLGQSKSSQQSGTGQQKGVKAEEVPSSNTDIPK